MNLYAALFALAVMGINETTYLVRKRFAQMAPVCPIGGDCEKVLMSEHSKIFILPLDIWGLIFYSTVAISCSLAVIGIGQAAFWQLVIELLLAFGAALSLFFTYLQWQVIRAWCFWCLTSAFTVWTMGAILLLSKIL